MKDIIKKLNDKLKSQFYYNHDVGKLTWFRTGGKSKLFIIVENKNELEIILNELSIIKFYIIGSGSNILIRDKGFEGGILKLGKEFNKIKIHNNSLQVGASLYDMQLSNFAMKNRLQGFEFYSGIPGTIGGAVKMNAGCYGNETKDILNKVEIINIKGEKKIISKDNLKLDYRKSNIKPDQIITSVDFKFKYGNIEQIKERINFIKKHRNNTQPITEKTSGSTFKNPKNKFAAKLIEEAGCKGMMNGNASISKKHANFIINNGNATATEIEKLGNEVVEKVYKKFSVLLDWEIKIIGDKN